MEDLISSIYHLVVDMTRDDAGQRPFFERAHTLFDVKEVIGINQVPNTMDEDSFLNLLVKYLTNKLYSTTSDLDKKGIVLLFRDESRLISYEKECKEPRKVLSNWIKSFNPVEQLFELVILERVKSLLPQFVKLLNDAHYNKAVKVTSKSSWDSCIIPSSWLNTHEISVVPIDKSSIWIESSWLESMAIDGDYIANSLACMNNFWGISCGNYTIPFVNADDRIKGENYVAYFIKMLQDVYSPDKQKGDISKDKLLPFISAGKKSDFCKLLSNLKYNLYLDSSIEIPEEYVPLFEEVLCFDNLSMTPQYQLFGGIPSEEQKERKNTLLGVYENEKKGTEYNLIGWVNAGMDNMEVTKSPSSNSSSEYVRVRTLLPRYSYYFVSDFFEDNFASILKEIGCQHMLNAVLSYRKAEESSVEIDALLFKNDGTLFFVENKTTMSKYTVESTIEKIERFHAILTNEYPLVTIEYLIVAPYCNPTLESSFKYFVKDGTAPYHRDGVAHRIYDFNIPLAQFEDVKLRCIVEPEYDLMKQKISELFQ